MSLVRSIDPAYVIAKGADIDSCVLLSPATPSSSKTTQVYRDVPDQVSHVLERIVRQFNEPSSARVNELAIRMISDCGRCACRSLPIVLKSSRQSDPIPQEQTLFQWVGPTSDS